VERILKLRCQRVDNILPQQSGECQHFLVSRVTTFECALRVVTFLRFGTQLRSRGSGWRQMVAGATL
jgi:hypothetical protein